MLRRLRLVNVGFFVCLLLPRSSSSSASIAIWPIYIGLLTIVGLIVFFVVWALLAPLESAAIAPGSIVPDSKKRVIQHLEGGIIEEILVKNGDRVTKGQTLIRLREITAKASIDIHVKQRMFLASRAARLIAERDNHKEVAFTDVILARADEDMEVAEIIAGEVRIFNERRQAIDNQIHILKQKIHQLKKEIDGLEAQRRGGERQLHYIRDEVNSISQLVEQGYAAKSQLFALLREQSRLEGNIGEYGASIAKAEQMITEAKLEQLDLINTRKKEVVEELQQVQAEMADIDERITASQDVLDRIMIVSPQEGIINELQFHTVGGVIPPGELIMEVVPENDKLVVEVKISPQDIDIVTPEMQAKIRLSAYKAKRYRCCVGLYVMLLLIA